MLPEQEQTARGCFYHGLFLALPSLLWVSNAMRVSNPQTAFSSAEWLLPATHRLYNAAWPAPEDSASAPIPSMVNNFDGPIAFKAVHTKLQRELTLNGISHVARCVDQDPARKGATKHQKATGTEPRPIHSSSSLPAGFSCLGNQLRANSKATQKQAPLHRALKVKSRELRLPLGWLWAVSGKG